MDELPEPGARDQHDQPVTNDPRVQDTDDGIEYDDAEYVDAAEYDDDYGDADYDDAAEYDTVNGVEYSGADYDGPMAAYADDEDVDYADAGYDDAGYAAVGYDDHQHQDGGYAAPDYEDSDYQDSDYQDSDYAAAAYEAAPAPEAPQAPEEHAHDAQAHDAGPATHPARSSGPGPVVPLPTAGLLAPQEPAADRHDVRDGHDGRDGRDRRRVGPVAAFALGALVGVLLLGTVWVTTSTTASQESAASGSPGDTTPQAAQVSRARAAKEHLAQCRAADAAQVRALTAADATLRQWQVHVDAMNQLVVGTITFQQATEFWNKTRQGAVQRLMRYLSADAAAHTLQASCPQTAGRHAPRSLRSCIHAVDTRRQALEAADVAVTTWRRHVRDMDRLRSGQLSPSMANQMWLANWQKGVTQLRAYRNAVHQQAPGNACHSG